MRQLEALRQTTYCGVFFLLRWRSSISQSFRGSRSSTLRWSRHASLFACLWVSSIVHASLVLTLGTGNAASTNSSGRIQRASCARAAFLSEFSVCCVSHLVRQLQAAPARLRLSRASLPPPPPRAARLHDLPASTQSPTRECSSGRFWHSSAGRAWRWRWRPRLEGTGSVGCRAPAAAPPARANSATSVRTHWMEMMRSVQAVVSWSFLPRRRLKAPDWV